jgi:hypothetical protein
MSDYLPDLRQGDEYTIAIDMSGDGVNPTDLTNYKAWFTLKKDILDTDQQAALQFSSIAGTNDADNPLGGIMYLVIPSSIMANVEAGVYFYDVQIKRPSSPGEGIKTLLPPWDNPNDKIQVLPQITRAIE